ncbi:MAG: o-succinylbenzoate--CoA ligase [Bacteroidota bacterium]|jgi:O-succinylbenzoic acid--CoA ligase
MRHLASLFLDYPVAETDFEQQVFAFCQAWRTGKTEFTFHTSGSTGEPKPILISRERLYLSAKMTGDWLKLEKGDVALLSLPPTYIAGVMVLVRALVHDLALILVEPCQNPLGQFPPTDIHIASFVPTQWATMVESGIQLSDYFQRTKGVLLGGASVPESLRKDYGFPVYETYGMTETVSHIAFRTWNQTAFQILLGVKIAQNDEDCLLICAPVTDNKWIETRDVVQMHESGHFTLIGRLDRVINSGGIKLQPEKIEAVYRSMTSLPLFVAGIPDAFWGQKLVLFLESSKPVSFFAETELLSSVEIPKEIIYLPSFIKTTSAKIDTVKTVALYLNSL